jgi:hypothetical protein
MDNASEYRPLNEGAPSTPQGTGRRPHSRELSPPPSALGVTSAPDDLSPSRRLGSTALTTLVLGTLVELIVIVFLIYFWTGSRSDQDGEHADGFWRFLVLNDYAARTITICALVLRTAVDLQSVVGTGLAAAVLIEARAVCFSDVAAFSVIRAINGGPWTLSRRLALSPRNFVRSIPAFTSLTLLLSVFAIQFSSTLLLSDFRDFGVANSQFVPTPVLQASAELLTPAELEEVGDSWLWRQALTSFPVFAEQILSRPVQEEGVRDTGFVKRALMPLDAQQRRTLRQFRGVAATHSSRVSCVRPEIQADIAGLRNYAGISSPPLLRSARIEGTVSWTTKPVLEGLFNCGLDGDCPVMAISCGLPYTSVDPQRTSILQQRPATMCIFSPPLHVNDTTQFTSESRAFLLFSSETSGQSWLDASKASNGTLKLPAPQASDEWAVYEMGNGIALKATLCQTNASMVLESVSAKASADPGEPAMSYNPTNKTWTTAQIVKMASVSSAATAADRGILTITENNTVSDKTLEEMFQGSTYRPSKVDARDIASSFFGVMAHLVYDSVSFIVDRGNETEIAGNASVFMCPNCQGLSGGHFSPHAYTALLFHATLNDTNSAAQALSSTFFWITQSLYYQALPGFDYGVNSTVMLSRGVSIPRVFTGLISVTALTLLNLASIAVLVALFLQRTKHSIYGNTWHTVAQLISPETRHILDRSTRVTDAEVTATLRSVGLAKVPAGIGTLQSGKVAVLRRNAMLRHQGYDREKQEQDLEEQERSRLTSAYLARPE